MLNDTLERMLAQCERARWIALIGPGMGYKDMLTGTLIRARKPPSRKVDSTEGGYF